MNTDELKKLFMAIVDSFEKTYADALSLRTVLMIHGHSALEAEAKSLQDAPKFRNMLLERFEPMRSAILESEDSDDLVQALLKMPTQGPVQ
jgi:hypothetical protein